MMVGLYLTFDFKVDCCLLSRLLEVLTEKKGKRNLWSHREGFTIYFTT